MPQNYPQEMQASLISTTSELTLYDLCEKSGLSIETITTYVEEGIITPEGQERTQWRFSRVDLVEAYRANRLERDLGLNAASINLILDLTAQVATLKARLQHLEQENS